jgi:hypothetical protein
MNKENLGTQRDTKDTQKDYVKTNRRQENEFKGRGLTILILDFQALKNKSLLFITISLWYFVITALAEISCMPSTLLQLKLIPYITIV